MKVGQLINLTNEKGQVFLFLRKEAYIQIHTLVHGIQKNTLSTRCLFPQLLKLIKETNNSVIKRIHAS